MNARKILSLSSALVMFLVFFAGCETTKSVKSSSLALSPEPVRSMDKVIVCYRLTSNTGDVSVKFDLAGKEISLQHDMNDVADRLIVLDLQPGVLSLVGFKRGERKIAYPETVSHTKLVQGTIYYAGDIHLEYEKSSRSFFVTVKPAYTEALSTLKEVYGGLIDQYKFQSLPIDAINGKRITLRSENTGPQVLNFYY